MALSSAIDGLILRIRGSFTMQYSYLMQYAIYHRLKDLSHFDMTLDRGEFLDPELESVRKGFLASEFYQAAKRIQRNSNPQGIFILVHHNKQVIQMVINEMDNIRFHEIERISDNALTGMATNLNSFKLVRHIETLTEGTYQKSKIAYEVGLDNKNFARYLKNKEIQNFIDQGYVVLHHRSIEIVKNIKN